MIQIEVTIITLAKELFKKAEYAANGGDTLQSSLDLAKDMGLDIESFWRRECSQALLQCDLLCELAHLADNGLSEEAKKELFEIESGFKNLAK